MVIKEHMKLEDLKQWSLKLNVYFNTVTLIPKAKILSTHSIEKSSVSAKLTYVRMSSYDSGERWY